MVATVCAIVLIPNVTATASFLVKVKEDTTYLGSIPGSSSHLQMPAVQRTACVEDLPALLELLENSDPYGTNSCLRISENRR